jgi:hypothetical protein
MDLNPEEKAEAEAAPPVIDETESAETSGLHTPPTSDENQVTEPLVPPPNQVKVDALRRLRALERRGKTVGTHLDELRALLTILFEQMPD